MMLVRELQSHANQPFRVFCFGSVPGVRIRNAPGLEIVELISVPRRFGCKRQSKPNPTFCGALLFEISLSFVERTPLTQKVVLVIALGYRIPGASQIICFHLLGTNLRIENILSLFLILGWITTRVRHPRSEYHLDKPQYEIDIRGRSRSRRKNSQNDDLALTGR